MKPVSRGYVHLEILLLRSERKGYRVARLAGKPDQRERMLDQAFDRIYSSSVVAEFSSSVIDSPHGCVDSFLNLSQLAATILRRLGIDNSGKEQR